MLPTNSLFQLVLVHYFIRYDVNNSLDNCEYFMEVTPLLCTLSESISSGAPISTPCFGSPRSKVLSNSFSPFHSNTLSSSFLLLRPHSIYCLNIRLCCGTLNDTTHELCWSLGGAAQNYVCMVTGLDEDFSEEVQGNGMQGLRELPLVCCISHFPISTVRNLIPAVQHATKVPSTRLKV